MKLTPEQIEQTANYMADSLEDHLDIVFWDSLIYMLTNDSKSIINFIKKNFKINKNGLNQ